MEAWEAIFSPKAQPAKECILETFFINGTQSNPINNRESLLYKNRINMKQQCGAALFWKHLSRIWQGGELFDRVTHVKRFTELDASTPETCAELWSVLVICSHFKMFQWDWNARYNACFELSVFIGKLIESDEHATIWNLINSLSWRLFV